ncbi:CC0125/CC1285 family lipoprotein [Shewanella sp. OMA3-2]|uniref:CC0125/CC1285 family lipoprotein n=1 Tax=Shewanella sp. OMA3-2 TaxID=2908650 RepID=UPI001F40EF19|nr:hypothetical protein [Shewanella sp. OMA3-2]UJF22622.1 hypothetical protein L0B17_04280 [Shewanella sp. OMA3-2]
MCNKIAFLAVFILMLLSGCTSHTKPQSFHQADGYRYTEHRITDNYFIISVVGKNKVLVPKNALAHAAILTEKQGYDWYIIVEQDPVSAFKSSFQSRIEIRMGKGVKP